MRLIDADKLRNIIYDTDREIVKLIDEQPTVNDLFCGECEKRIRADERAKTIEEIGMKLCAEIHFGYEVEKRVCDMLEQLKEQKNG